MKVFYHSALRQEELLPDRVVRAIPCKAHIELNTEKTDGEFEIFYNGSLIDDGQTHFECNETAELIIRQDGNRYTYSVRPLLPPLSPDYTRTYSRFSREYHQKRQNVISSIQRNRLKLYAVDQSTEIHDWTEMFQRLDDAFPAFKTICEKPKSHLKSVNEVRPIETVKRIGYESIPYLAAHSEDWLARTASGLKPARLFSRVEDDDYQIYENCVVKTLVDFIIGFLRKTEKQLRDQLDQLNSIMSSGVQTGSFGFDVDFQKAVSELMASDKKGDEYRSSSMRKADDQQKKALSLLKRYRMLRQTRLYRYLRNVKQIANPLIETNILLMDKYYSQIFKLWKYIHRELTPTVIETANNIPFSKTCESYSEYCTVLCEYAAHILQFEPVKDGYYRRSADQIEMEIRCTNDGLVRVSLRDTEQRSVTVPAGMDVPILPGSCSHHISYDGRRLTWPNDLSNNEIEAFCSMFKTRESRGREQAEEKKKYSKLQIFLDQEQRSFSTPHQTSFTIIPLAIELKTENLQVFRAAMENISCQLVDVGPEEQIIIALPLCNECEQQVIEYAKMDGQRLSVLPLTMFDINSFRRLQNVLYRQILTFENKKGFCPNCGGKMRPHENQYICENCNKLTLTTTRCPNPECRKKYLYMGYPVSVETLYKMQNVSRENFYQWDSLYQYKDVIHMSVNTGKVRTICPYCQEGRVE